jgi:hypothetical protein
VVVRLPGDEAMPRSQSDERLLAKLKREAPEVLDAKVDVGAVLGRLLKAQPESREARKAAAKKKAAPPKK